MFISYIFSGLAMGWVPFSKGLPEMREDLIMTVAYIGFIPDWNSALSPTPLIN